MLPRCASTTDFAVGMPRPAPFAFPCVTKGSKSWGKISGAKRTMANCSAYHPTRLPDESLRTLTVVPRDESEASATSAVHSSVAEKIEIGHVLFIDIVGYSQLLIHAQTELQQELKEIVRGTEQFRAAEEEGKLLRLPTGDGMVLVFRDSPEAPARCALEIARLCKTILASNCGWAFTAVRSMKSATSTRTPISPALGSTSRHG
jgi:hypothetical protein